jgi:flagellar hook-basal body complex protein FliE
VTVPVGAVGAPGLGEWALPKVGGAEWSVGGADPAKKASEPDPAGGFGEMLGDAVGQLQQTQDVAAAQSQALATGQTQDVTSVVTAVQEASLSMQLASQVRNKAVEAYSEIFRTQV